MTSHNKSPRGTWLKKWGWQCAALFALTVLVTVSSMVNQNNRDALGGQALQIAQLEAQIAQAIESHEEDVAAAQAFDVGAPDGDVDAVLARISADREIIDDLVSTMFTWDSHESYEAARSELAHGYGLGWDSRILTTLMPPGPVNVDGEGREYPYIDAAGLDSTMDSFTATPAGVLQDMYSYVVMVTVLGTSNDGSTSASVTNLVEVTLGQSGDVVELTAHATQMPIKTAHE